MAKGIVLHAVVPVRAAAKESSEQVTQLLFAETVDFIEKKTRWIKIRNHADNQEGWADAKMIAPLSEEEWKQYHAVPKNARVLLPMTYAVSENNGQTIPLSAGTVLPDYNNGEFAILGVKFRVDPAAVLLDSLKMTEENLMLATRFFLNIPYLWGGKNALGYDCSGFTQVIMSLFGAKLPRNASEQALTGKEVSSLSQIQAGDLAFFGHETKTITHVGILLDPNRVIHCSGRVKVEKVDSTGIFSIEQGGYTHRLISIRCVL